MRPLRGRREPGRAPAGAGSRAQQVLPLCHGLQEVWQAGPQLHKQFIQEQPLTELCKLERSQAPLARVCAALGGSCVAGPCSAVGARAGQRRAAVPAESRTPAGEHTETEGAWAQPAPLCCSSGAATERCPEPSGTKGGAELRQGNAAGHAQAGDRAGACPGRAEQHHQQ